MTHRRTRVKICGITRADDAAVAVASGADAIGLVFYPASPRCVTLDQAARICASLPPFVTVVGLFVDADSTAVQQTLAQVPITLLQFHGDETSAFCEQFNRPYIKALRMRDDTDVAAAMAVWTSARALLLDTYRPGTPGGTGETFNWERVPGQLSHRVVLAGGLAAENVERAIRTVRPYAVDVSGGVESAPGRKDAGKIHAFLAAVRAADADLRPVG